MVDTAAAALGGLDVVVNNAGRYVAHPIAEVSYEEWQAAWRETLGVNLVGAANVMYCAVKHMRNGGRIINVSSRGAFRGEPRNPAYGASKAGLNALGQSLAVALGARGIAVATVAPGFVETAMARADLKDRGAEIRRAEPVQPRAPAPRRSPPPSSGSPRPRPSGQRRGPRSQRGVLPPHVARVGVRFVSVW
jgi:NAD(P)-dependent dehydrogenase (short-subunit alcohol dehydrogenase family)